MEKLRCNGWWMGPVAALLGVAGGLGSLGCSHSCADTFTCDWGIEEPECPEDPAETADGVIPAECGIWVSASLGDDGNDGTPQAPVATLHEAFSRAVTGPRRVYACAETFEESVTWAAGIALHGGFYCSDLDWRYAAGTSRTTLEPPPDRIPLTLKGSNYEEASLLTDLVLRADDATEPGGSSIAVLALADSHAEIRRSGLQSGNGADGADGEDGGHLGVSAPSGLPGNDGAAACTATIGLGGDMAALLCDEDSSTGGEGGDSGETTANPGHDGTPEPADNPQGFGQAGQGEDLVAGLFCTPGIGGAAGKDGEPGVGATWPPRLTSDGYLGVWGGDGEHGRAGQGGGGGGASVGSAAACGAMPHGGAGGGSGGTGGCGGKGGRGGQPGGASIGLATLTAEIVLTDIEISTGNGGNGGRGGLPQQGGQGGLPGVGGAGLPVAGGPNPGCAGGAGGYGGDGGPAGGGLGGSSLAVAYVAGQPALAGKQKLNTGHRGYGGLGGDPSLAKIIGEDGKQSPLEPLLP